jgi:DNA-binding CsgD family transcriptional regulator
MTYRSSVRRVAEEQKTTVIGIVEPVLLWREAWVMALAAQARHIHPELQFIGIDTADSEVGDPVQILLTPSRLTVSAAPAIAGDVALSSSAGPVEWLQAVRGELNDRRRPWTPPVLALAALSERESAVLQMVADGLTAAQIAAQIGVSTRTVQGIKSRILAKWGVETAAQAVAQAVTAGVIERHR